MTSSQEAQSIEAGRVHPVVEDRWNWSTGWTWKCGELRGYMGRSSHWSTLLLAFAGASMVAVAAAGQVAFLSKGEAHPVAFERGLAIEFPIWWYWALAAPAVLALGRREPLVGGTSWWALPTHLVALAGLLVLHAVVVAGVGVALVPGASDFMQNFVESIFNRAIFDILVYAAILGIGYTNDYHRRFQDRALDTARLETELAHAELRALKMQLHPHFLFNTLNTATVLVEENPGAAKDVLGLLADLLRATLDQSGVQEIRLSEELELLQTYLTIERTRFPDRLTVRLDIASDTRDAWVPNLVLQPLVENAVRYAIAPRSAPGRITIRTRRRGGILLLSIADDGPGMKSGPNRAGLGISTTRARLERLYGANGQLELAPASEGQGTVATVTLPYRVEESGQ